MLVDIKYLSFVSSRLRNFKKKNDRLWNCSCPLCGDSSKDARKARGYFFPHKARLIYKCHKCGLSMSFSNFLKKFDSTMFKEYSMERIGKKPRKIIEELIVPKSNMLRLSHNTNILADLTPIEKMPQQWQRYLIKRKIPMKMLTKYFYYTDSFKAFANKINRTSFNKKALAYEETRIVIPFFDENEKVYCIQGRETRKSYAKYVTIKKDEDSAKVFGLDRIDLNKDVYVVEGPIDSMFLDNAIAVCGADLVSGSESVKANKVMLFDNEPRSSIAQKKMEQVINTGQRIVIFPHDVYQKDVNEMVIAGIDVCKMIRERTFEGLSAKMEFGLWKK